MQDEQGLKDHFNRARVIYGQCSDICRASHSFIPIVIESVLGRVAYPVSGATMLLFLPCTESTAFYDHAR